MATVTRAPASWALSQICAKPRSEPSVAGYCSSAPATDSVNRKESGSPTLTSMPRASARVLTTAIVCGWQRWSTRYTGSPLAFEIPQLIPIASAAAVASSRRDALAISKPVRSLTTV